jgi:hypothetical protein
METIHRVEQYHGKLAVLQTWEQQPTEVQDANAKYILELRRVVRQIRNYISHRSDPEAEII